MIKNKWVGVLAVFFMAAAVLIVCFAYISPSLFTPMTITSAYKYIDEMDKTKIMDIKIVADEVEWANMLENATLEEYIPATVIINDTVIENVGIRPKGNSSLSMVAMDSTTDRFSFKIEFDHYITGQTWLGLDKLVVNNMQGDATYMKEYLSYDIMDYAGVNSPLYAFSDITVNGEAWGFYLAVEAIEDSFAERTYGYNHGELYKPESMGMRGGGRMYEFIDRMQDNTQTPNMDEQLQNEDNTQLPNISTEPPNEDNVQAPNIDEQPQGEGNAQFPNMERQPREQGDMQMPNMGQPPENQDDMQIPDTNSLNAEQQLFEDGQVVLLSQVEDSEQSKSNEEITKINNKSLTDTELSEAQSNMQAWGENARNMQNPQVNNRGGGMGGMASDGVSLQYIDDDPSSYSAIFENSAFDTNESDHMRVIETLKKLSNGEDLENVVDIEATLKYFAVHTVTVNLDSYISNMGHNYYLYEKDGKLTILPWDYNLAFGGFQSGNAQDIVNFSIDTPVSGVSLSDRPLLGKLLEVPEYLELYHSYLQQIVSGYFNSGQFVHTIDSLNNMIETYVANDPTAFYNYDEYIKAVIELKELGLLRAESIKGQLDGIIPSTNEGQKNDSSKLIDASSIDLSVLGSQGGGMRIVVNGGPGALSGISDIDIEVMESAMEVIRTSNDGTLTDEQMNTLKELGLTDEQITQITNFSSDGFIRRQFNSEGEVGNNTVEGTNPNQLRQATGVSGETSVIASEYDRNTWIFLGTCTLLILSGVSFVLSYKRRRA